MATIIKFEELKVWKKSRELTYKIYQVTKDSRFSKDFDLRSQIRRASISVMSNIAEGFDRGGNREFIQFLSYAKGSISEIESQLYIALDQEYVTKDIFKEFYDLAEEIGKMITNLIKYLNKSSFKGSKFKQSNNSELETRNEYDEK